MKITLTDAINWAFNIIDNQDLTDTQQLTLLHIINRINRNFWNSTKISTKKLSAVMQKDPRTIKDAIEFLLTEGILTLDSQGRYFIGYLQQLRLFNETEGTVEKNGGRKSTPTNSGGTAGSSGTDRKTETKPANTAGLEELEIFSGKDIAKSD